MAAATAHPDKHVRDVEEPLLTPSKTAQGPGGDAEGQGGDGAGVEREAIQLDICRLLAEAKPESCILTVATIALFITAGTSLLIPAVFGNVVNAIADHDNAKLKDNAIVLVVITVVSSLFAFLRGFLFNCSGQRVVARLRNKLFHAITQQDVAFFDSNRTGELVSRLGSDVTILKDAVTTNISMFLRSAATVLGGITYLFVLNWRLALVLMGIVPLTAISAALYGRYVRDLAKAGRKALAQATEVAEESMGAIRTVRSFAGEGRQRDAYGVRIAETLELGIKTAMAYGLFSGGMQGVTTLAFTGIVWYGGTLVLAGTLSVGTLTAFLLYAVQIGASLAMLSGLFGNLMQAVGANDRVFQILDRTPTIPLTGGRTLPRSDMQGEVALTGVTFAYPSRPDAPVLRDFNLTLRPGTVTALVGPSGGGKSTVVNLVEGFYTPQKGSVRVDGQDLQGLDGSWWRQQVGLVRQEPVLFSTSIADNIAYAVPEATPDTIVAAAKVANAHDFVTGFPDGYDTHTGERGVRLSGGQKQRIAIARAVAKDPLLCIFDEASSALDAESEAVVQGALDRLMQGRTVLVIAHRLSTVRDADMVVVVDGGQVVGRGTHDELLASNELYANLVARQLMPGTGDVDSSV